MAPKPTGHGAGEKEASAEKRKTESQKELLDKIDLTGLGEWSQNEKKNDSQELITEYAGIFAMSDMDLGKTSLVKHSIRIQITPHSRSFINEFHPVCMRKLGSI